MFVFRLTFWLFSMKFVLVRLTQPNETFLSYIFNALLRQLVLTEGLSGKQSGFGLNQS